MYIPRRGSASDRWSSSPVLTRSANPSHSYQYKTRQASVGPSRLPRHLSPGPTTSSTIRTTREKRQAIPNEPSQLGRLYVDSIRIKSSHHTYYSFATMGDHTEKHIHFQDGDGSSDGSSDDEAKAVEVRLISINNPRLLSRANRV